ncbi:M56 family metallopeptidase [Spirillospora sp. NPDC048824]|uniref:M56 family metallopeptidase n=1 Tax=Spirillospora sp. NPDC048824 TaxID=3364526 RepID=UPI00371B1FA0
MEDGGANALWTSRPDLIPGVLILALTSAGTLKGTWALGQSFWHLRSFAYTVRRYHRPVPPALRALADRLGLGARIRVIATSCPFALTYGPRRPHVLVSTGLLDVLNEEELAAVLVHERAHLRSRDPLKNLCTRVILARHFYLPGVARLRRRFTMGRELAADRRAAALHGTTALAGSLLQVSEGPAWTKAVPATALASDELLAARITQLETGTEPSLRRPGRLARAGAAIWVTALVAACVWSAQAVGQSTPGCMF